MKKRSKERALQNLAEAGDEADMTLAEPVHGPGAEDAAPADAASSGATHPEEMKGSVELRITDHVTLKASVRTTPAGLVGAAVLLAAILVPVMWNRRPR